MDVIVDGYNVIGVEQGLSGGLEHRRNWLIQRIAAYQALKKVSITVVFDGWLSGSAAQTEEWRSGLRVVYSRVGEKADAVIVQSARAKGSGCVVVTSDRQIIREVERFGAVAIYSDEFDRVLRSVERPWADRPAGDGELAGGKGSSHRLSKSERRRQEKLRKLKLY